MFTKGYLFIIILRHFIDHFAKRQIKSDHFTHAMNHLPNSLKSFDLPMYYNEPIDFFPHPLLGSVLFIFASAQNLWIFSLLTYKNLICIHVNTISLFNLLPHSKYSISQKLQPTYHLPQHDLLADIHQQLQWTYHPSKFSPGSQVRQHVHLQSPTHSSSFSPCFKTRSHIWPPLRFLAMHTQ